jgi:hypothetical protein
MPYPVTQGCQLTAEQSLHRRARRPEQVSRQTWKVVEKKKLYSITIKISKTANQNKPYINASHLIFLEQTTTKCWVCPKWMRIPQNAGLDVLL